MLADLGVCPSLAKDGAPRCALESSCRRIPVSAHLAGVGLLLAFLSTLGCLVRAPGVGMNMAEGDTLISVDYEIFGKVQGSFSTSTLRLRVKSWDWLAGSRTLTRAQCKDNCKVPSLKCVICRNGLRQEEVPNRTSTEQTSGMRKSS